MKSNTIKTVYLKILSAIIVTQIQQIFQTRHWDAVKSLCFSSPVLIATVFSLLCLLKVSGCRCCQRCCALILKLCGNSLKAEVKGYHCHTHPQGCKVSRRAESCYETAANLYMLDICDPCLTRDCAVQHFHDSTMRRKISVHK